MCIEAYEMLIFKPDYHLLCPEAKKNGEKKSYSN